MNILSGEAFCLVMEDSMKIKFLALPVLALSVLAVPALAYSPYDDVPITGSQLTDMPSQRSNVTMTGSFLRHRERRDDRYRHVSRSLLVIPARSSRQWLAWVNSRASRC
jgi:hypothetical protein